MAIAIAAAFGQASAAEVIKFDVDGTGAQPVRDVSSFDWAVGNVLIVGGNPFTVGETVTVLAHARLGGLLDANSAPIPNGVPNNIEITFVTRYPAVVLSVIGNTATLGFGSQGVFEMYAHPAGAGNSNMLAGTGFNDGTLIMSGQVNNVEGNFTVTSTTPVALDQTADNVNNYPGQLTVTGLGTTKIRVQVDPATVDANYFPGFGPTQIDTLVAQFNTSTVVPFQQQNPSASFWNFGAFVAPALGTVNGGAGFGPDLLLQGDPNQSFQPGIVVEGACRVTYGGNDPNGNASPNKFGSAEACAKDGRGSTENCYTFGGQVGAPAITDTNGGPFGEHTHHQKSGPAGDFVFHAGTHSAPKSTRITAAICKDPGACQPAAANAGFKQIDFEGTGSFRSIDATAIAYLTASVDGQGNPKGAAPTTPGLPPVADRDYYFRVDMDDLGEPGSKWASKKTAQSGAPVTFFNADQNNPLSTPDPLFPDPATNCSQSPDIYQFFICPTTAPCESAGAMYRVRGFLTGGNIQLHKVIK
jgi:hypothetical protein